MPIGSFGDFNLGSVNNCFSDPDSPIRDLKHYYCIQFWDPTPDTAIPVDNVFLNSLSIYIIFQYSFTFCAAVGEARPVVELSTACKNVREEAALAANLITA